MSSQARQDRKIQNKKSVKSTKKKRNENLIEKSLKDDNIFNEKESLEIDESKLNEWNSQENNKNIENMKGNTSEESSPYKQLLDSSIRENAKRIRKEFIGRQYSANQYLSQLNYMVLKFESVRDELHLASNYYINYFFCMFGYRYQSEIKSINFFHFASQSWIIEVFNKITRIFHCNSKQSKKDEKIYSGNYSFSEILDEILRIEIDETRFLKNLQLIAGTIYFNDPALRLTEMKLGKYFLENINTSCNKAKLELIPETLSKTEFEAKLMKILLKSVEMTLNKLESVVRDKILDSTEKQYIGFYEQFQTLQSRNLELNSKNYLKVLVEDPAALCDDKYGDQAGLLSSAEAFYNFAIGNFNLLIQDIISFNSHSTNFLYKLGIILSKNKEKIEILCTGIYQNFIDTYNKALNNFDYGAINCFNIFWERKTIDLKENKLFLETKSKLDIYKNWMKDTYDNKLKIYPNLILDKLLKQRITYTIFESVFIPARDFSVAVTAGSFSLIIKISVQCIHYIKELTQIITNSMFNIYYFIKDEIVFSKDKLIEITYNREQEIIYILISKKLQIIDSKRFNEFIERINNMIKKIKINETACLINRSTIEKTTNKKEYLMEKYRKFLSCSPCTEENKTEVNIQYE